jgi:hypothetical protein
MSRDCDIYVDESAEHLPLPVFFDRLERGG